jgi:hypothetical protein
MITSRWLIALSVAVNLVLAAIWSRPGTRSSSVSTEGIHDIPAATRVQTDAISAATSHPTSGSFPPEAPRSAEDRRQLLRQLEQAGYPRRMIARILTQLHANEMIARQRAALHGAAAEQPYWKPPSGISREQSREIAKQQRQFDASLAELLGDDYLAELPGTLAMLQSRYGPLPAEKLHRVHSLIQDYAELRMELQSGSLGGPPDRDKQSLLEQERRADLEALLTPQELFEYDLRHSSTAHGLRGEYAAAQLTEAEFRSLFQLYQDHERQYPKNGQTGGAPRTTADELLLQQVRALVDPVRAAELMQARDRQARRENQLFARLGLPLSVAGDVVTIKRDVAERANRIQGDTTLTAEQRREQLAGLVNEAGQRLNAKLGPRGLSAYRDHGGDWLERLQLQAARGAPAADL